MGGWACFGAALLLGWNSSTRGAPTGLSLIRNRLIPLFVGLSGFISLANRNIDLLLVTKGPLRLPDAPYFSNCADILSLSVIGIFV